MRLRRARGRTCAAGGALKDRNKRNFRRVRPHRPKAPVSEYRWAARCYRSARPRPRRLRRQCRVFRRANLDFGPGTAAPPARGRRGGTAVSAARSSASPRRTRAGGACGCARAAPAPVRNGVFRRLPRAARATRSGRRVTAPTGLGSATRPGPGEARIGGPGRKIQPGFKPGRPTLLMARATRAAKRQARRPAGPRSCPVGGRGPARISWARRHRIRVLVRRRIRRYRRARVARVSRVSSALNTVL